MKRMMTFLSTAIMVSAMLLIAPATASAHGGDYYVEPGNAIVLNPIVVTADRLDEHFSGWYVFPQIRRIPYYQPPAVNPASPGTQVLVARMAQGKEATKNSDKKELKDICGRADWTAAIPDIPLGYDFRGGCANHDRCRGVTGNNRAGALQCHENFLRDLTNWCWNNVRLPDQSVLYKGGNFLVPAISQCLGLAYVYYGNVVVFDTPG